MYMAVLNGVRWHINERDYRRLHRLEATDSESDDSVYGIRLGMCM